MDWSLASSMYTSPAFLCSCIKKASTICKPTRHYCQSNERFPPNLDKNNLDYISFYKKNCIEINISTGLGAYDTTDRHTDTHVKLRYNPYNILPFCVEG